MGDNDPRLQEGPHIESWFIRANHPELPRAVWIKATLLGKQGGGAIAESWCNVFDGDRTFAAKATVPLTQAKVETAPMRFDAAGGAMELSDGGGWARGRLANGQGEVKWDLTFRRVGGPLGEPMCLYPTRAIIDGSFPKKKLLTPTPVAKVTGHLEWDDVRWELDGWDGMQGHNWGKEHAPNYAWGQCVFFDGAHQPFCVLEGASGRVRLVANVKTPLISLLVVRRGAKEYRFDRVVDLWRQDARIDVPQWSLRMRGKDGEAQLVMRGRPRRTVELEYVQPSGQRLRCLNSKTAEALLRVNPVNDDSFECTNKGSAALEFLAPLG